MGTITSLLQDCSGGSEKARNELFSRAYDELRILARIKLFSQKVNSFQSAELVNEAFQRLAAGEKLDAKNRKHFYFLLARAMQDVLIDHIRALNALKRGGEFQRVPMIDVSAGVEAKQHDLQDLVECLEELKIRDVDAATVVQLRYYGGLTLNEIAEAMNQSVASVRGQWEYARAWLHSKLEEK